MSNEFSCGNIYIRKNHLPNVGDRVDGHKHNFDHTTLFQRGSFHVKAKLPNGTLVERDFVAPAFALIRADVEHEITATVADSEFWCVYSHRDAQGDVVQEWNGWNNSAYV
jgi:hypothetical protein